MSAPATALPISARRPDALPLVPELVARLAAFGALALFGALHWFAMVFPGAGDRAVLAVAIGLGLGAALATWPAALSPRARALAAVAMTLAATAVALVAVGLPARLLWPTHWGELTAGLGRGFDTLPRVNVPYGGLNEWTRLIILLGGALLVVMAAALAFWPSARPRGRVPALVLLVTLYATPSVEITFSAEYLRGSLLALLAVSFLWLDRVPRAGTRVAGMLACVAAVGGLALAPALDGNRPWIDYEKIANSVSAGRQVAFAWDHRYGPLNWSREGREVLRIRAKHSAYWKAEALEQFDGARWISTRTGWQPGELDEGVVFRPEHVQTLRILVRNMSSDDFVGAGTTLAISDGPARANALSIGGVGQWRSDRVLRKGDAWRARVYTPRPTAAQLRAAGTGSDVSARYLTLPVPPASALRDPAPVEGAPPREPETWATVLFPVFGEGGGDSLVEPGPLLAGEILRGGASFSVGSPDYVASVMERSAYARSYALALSLRDQAATPYDFVKAVERHLARGFTYDEIVPRHPVPLESFLFSEKRGYCQQFSGAMAMLLRMGGVPARVAAGFTPGSLDKSTKEYVVRDVDAHSWVEAWFPGWGWVPFDPTPSAAPARSQAGVQAISAATGDARDVSKGNQPVDLGGGSSGAGLSSDSNRWLLPAVIVGAIVALLFLIVLRLLHRGGQHHPDRLVDDLERALHRAGHAVDPSDTLRSLERRVAVSSGAVGYLRAVAAVRYGGHRRGPTGAQRRALRGALGHGLGALGRLRAWWAVPPRLHR